MQVLLSLIRKELLLLVRDLHALLLLFVMPCVFILIMSFALSEQMGEQRASVNYYFFDEGNGVDSARLLAGLSERGGVGALPGAGIDRAELVERVRTDQAQFLLLLKRGYKKKLSDGAVAMELYAAPGTGEGLVESFAARVRETLAIIYLEELTAAVEEVAPGELPNISLRDALQVQSLYQPGDDQATAIPTSVQQNVPAWLLFAMFFIAIPLSTTLVREREQGTRDRLRTMAVAEWQLMLGKLAPFMLINLIQVAAMLMIGVYVIPALGGEKLQILGSGAAVLLIAVAASLAAVSYALCIAQLARTIEQATIATGVFNIIMAAIGGIMVPRFVMPGFMQNLSSWSPMAWGLDGFLDVLLRAGEVADVAPEAARLAALAVLLLGLASWLARRRE